MFSQVLITRVFKYLTKLNISTLFHPCWCLRNNIFFQGYDATWIGGTSSDGKWIVLAIDRRKDCKMSVGYVCLKVSKPITWIRNKKSKLKIPKWSKIISALWTFLELRELLVFSFYFYFLFFVSTSTPVPLDLVQAYQ